MRRQTTLVYVIVFIAFVDVFAMLPTVSPYALSLGADVVGVGIAVAAYSVTNLVFNVVGGVALDRYGRRRVLLAGLAGASVAMGGYALAGTPGQLVVARLLHGVAGGLMMPAVFTIAGDLAPERGRGRIMGRVGAVIGAAAVVAPALAGLLRQAGDFTLVFTAVAALMGLGFLLAAALEEPAGMRAGTAARGQLRALVARRGIQVALVAVVALTFAAGVLAAFLPLHAEALTGSPAVTGGLFTAYAVVASAAMLSRLSGGVDLRGPSGPTAVGLVVLAAALALLATAPPIGLTWTAAATFGLGYGLVFPAGAGFLAAATGPEERGRVFGLFNACFSLGLVLGPSLSGFLAAAIDPFVPATVVCLAAAAFSVASRRALASHH